MTVRKTVLWVDEKGDRIDVTLSEQENEYLKELTLDDVRHSTKGTVAYEILCMYTELNPDKVGELEEAVDEQLSDAGIEFEEEFAEESRFDGDDTNRKQRVMWLPPSFKLQLDGLNGHLSTILSECLDKYSRSRFDDRSDRIEAKQALLEDVEVEVTEETVEQAEEPVEGGDEYRFDSPEEYEDRASDVTQTTEARVSYLQEYLDVVARECGYTSDRYPETHDELVPVAEELFTCSEPSAEKYANGVQIRQDEILQEKTDAYRDSDEWAELSERVQEEGQISVSPRLNDVENLTELCKDPSNEYGLIKDSDDNFVLTYESDMVDGLREVSEATTDYIVFGEKRTRHAFGDEEISRYRTWTKYSKHTSKYSQEELPELLAEFTQLLREESFQHSDDISVQKAAENLFSRRSDEEIEELAAEAAELLN
jgi:hypothetical protein